ncbi:MAG: hypothetical protein IIY82_06690 [Firmicutes bacterium]|nr:hypothetical protein [Bacillota bacterium]
MKRHRQSSLPWRCRFSLSDLRPSGRLLTSGRSPTDNLFQFCEKKGFVATFWPETGNKSEKPKKLEQVQTLVRSGQKVTP